MTETVGCAGNGTNPAGGIRLKNLSQQSDEEASVRRFIEIRRYGAYGAAHRQVRLADMCFRFIGFTAFMLFGFAAGALAQAVAPQSGRAAEAHSAWSFVVIKLKYAEAEEIARVLTQLLPPTVSVAPYSQTNSIVIAGDRATLEEIGALDIEAEL